jgi:hypothetical protein
MTIDVKILRSISARVEQAGELDAQIFEALEKRIERAEGAGQGGGGLGLDARELANILFELVAPLKLRLAALESSQMKYIGTFKDGVTYRRGSVVTHGGSAWHADEETTDQRPGTGPGWRLMVKRGQDARGVNPALAKEWQA